MPRWLRIALIVLAVVVVLIQFIPVERTNPLEPAPLEAPADVLAVLEQSCFDCHSHRTRWPWYAWVAPVSWFITHDVEEGRQHLDFSNWGGLPTAKRDHLRKDIWEEVSEGEMPLETYTWLHRDAALTAADLAVLRRWTGGEAAATEGAAGAGDETSDVEDRESHGR
jgi:hypothetical protein